MRNRHLAVALAVSSLAAIPGSWVAWRYLIDGFGDDPLSSKILSSAEFQSWSLIDHEGLVVGTAHVDAVDSLAKSKFIPLSPASAELRELNEWAAEELKVELFRRRGMHFFCERRLVVGLKFDDADRVVKSYAKNVLVDCIFGLPNDQKKVGSGKKTAGRSMPTGGATSSIGTPMPMSVSLERSMR